VRIMQTLRNVGMDTGRLTDEEILYIDNRVVETVRPLLVGRQLFPVFTLPNAGILKVRGYKRTDRAAARISLYGSDGGPLDRSQKTAFDILVPVIDAEFELPWRDLEASRGMGMPIDTQEAENAARQVAEEEDEFLITGEHTNFRALGVEGLATATGRNTSVGGDWSANAFTYVNNAIGELETDGHYGPYALLIKPSWWRQITGAFVTNTATTIAEKVAQLCNYGVFKTDSLYESDGTTHNALVVEPSQENFELVVGRDLEVKKSYDKNGNMEAVVREVLAPRIKRPTSICEITGLT
jgi:uncharacterized linocin/CFP29 family protein